MKRKYFRLVIVAGLLVLVSGLAYAWGSWAHKRIARAAVFSLPEEMRVFYYNHIDFITQSSVVPDLRRPLLGDSYEGPRHYINLEEFEQSPDQLPKTPDAIHDKYDWKFLNKTGVLPWHIQKLTDKLTQAFKTRNQSEILFLSAELSHYIADAHMPLHTTNNHDGQLTGQKGVHALWESVLPPMFGDGFNFHAPPAKYIDDVTVYTWKMIMQSHNLVDTLLAAEMRVRNVVPEEKRYKKDATGKPVLFYGKPVYSDEYARLFQKELGNMVECQLRLSIIDISNYWYTAWVNAGKPELLSLDDPALTKENRRKYRKELRAWKKGNLLYLDAGDR